MPPVQASTLFRCDADSSVTHPAARVALAATHDDDRDEDVHRRFSHTRALGTHAASISYFKCSCAKLKARNTGVGTLRHIPIASRGMQLKRARDRTHHCYTWDLHTVPRHPPARARGVSSRHNATWRSRHVGATAPQKSGAHARAARASPGHQTFGRTPGSFQFELASRRVWRSGRHRCRGVCGLRAGRAAPCRGMPRCTAGTACQGVPLSPAKAVMLASARLLPSSRHAACRGRPVR